MKIEKNKYFIYTSEARKQIGKNSYASDVYSFLGKYLQIHTKGQEDITKPLTIRFISESLGIGKSKTYLTIQYLVDKGVIQKIKEDGYKYYQFRLNYTKDKCDKVEKENNENQKL